MGVCFHSNNNSICDNTNCFNEKEHAFQEESSNLNRTNTNTTQKSTVWEVNETIRSYL